MLNLGAQRAEDAARLKQRGTEPLGDCAKRFATLDGTRLGNAIEIRGWNQLGVQSKGNRRRYIELLDLLSDITRDELDSRLHFWHHPLGFLDPFQAALAEPFVLGNSANLLDMLLDSQGNESTVAAHAALEIDKMVIVAKATDIRLDLIALCSEPRVLATGRFEHLLGLLQAHGCLWGPPRPALCGLVIRAYREGLQPFDVAILFRTHGDKSNRSLLEVCSMSQPAMKGYSAEFKERAVKLAVESDQPIAQTARDLGVNENTLHTWIGKYHRAVRQEKEVNDEHLYEELKRLRKDNARLKEERDILKKAAAYFAQQLP